METIWRAARSSNLFLLTRCFSVKNIGVRSADFIFYRSKQQKPHKNPLIIIVLLCVDYSMNNGKMVTTWGRLLFYKLNYRQMAASSLQEKPVESSIRSKLEARFQPVHFDIINESHMHNVPKGSESHFKVVVVSEAFQDIPLLKRHRLVNEVLQPELQAGVHALSIVAKTPAQWEESNTVSSSPACRGGAGL